jgi:hypothetical protein
MTKQRYDIRHNDDGTWAVFDAFTGLTAEVNDIPQDGLDAEQADDLVDLLNLLDLRKQGVVEN